MLMEDLGVALFESIRLSILNSFALEVPIGGWRAENIIEASFLCDDHLSSSKFHRFSSGRLRSHDSQADIRGRRLEV